MGMACGDDCVAAVQIEVFISVGVKDAASAASAYFDVEKTVYVEKVHFYNSFGLKSGGFEAKSGSFFKSEEEIHIVYSLAARTLEQIVDYRDDEELVAALEEVDHTFVSVDDLLEIGIFVGHYREGMGGIIFVIHFARIVDGKIGIEIGGGKYSPCEIASKRNEVQSDCVIRLERKNGLPYFLKMLVLEWFVNGNIVGSPAEVSC
jgi:hypothetical protein